MKETIKGLVIITMFFCVLGACGWYESHYTREATVIDVTNDVVTVVDKCDYVWEFYGNGFKVNDEVKMRMNTMHTDNYIFDDEIENVKLVN